MMAMTLMKNLKETAQKEMKDAVDITKLTAENIKQEVKQEFNKQKIQSKMEHMQTAYHEIKRSERDLLQEIGSQDCGGWQIQNL